MLASLGIKLVHFSTDFVFDGTSDRPYRMDDPTNPLSAYGRSKLLGEKFVLDQPMLDRLIIRTAWLYGPPGNDFPAKILAAAERARAADEPLRLVADEVGSPSYAPDIAEGIAELIGSAAVDSPPGWQNSSAPSAGIASSQRCISTR